MEQVTYFLSLIASSFFLLSCTQLKPSSKSAMCAERSPDFLNNKEMHKKLVDNFD